MPGRKTGGGAYSIELLSKAGKVTSTWESTAPNLRSARDDAVKLAQWHVAAGYQVRNTATDAIDYRILYS